jgi:hypothetical protein
VTLLVQLDADAVGILLLDDPAYEIGRLARDVRRSDEDELATVDLDDPDLLRVVSRDVLWSFLRDVRAPLDRSRGRRWRGL